jgi:hypothetical protein
MGLCTQGSHKYGSPLPGQLSAVGALPIQGKSPPRLRIPGYQKRVRRGGCQVSTPRRSEFPRTTNSILNCRCLATVLVWFAVMSDIVLRSRSPDALGGSVVAYFFSRHHKCISSAPSIGRTPSNMLVKGHIWTTRDNPVFQVLCISQPDLSPSLFDPVSFHSLSSPTARATIGSNSASRQAG